MTDIDPTTPQADTVAVPTKTIRELFDIFTSGFAAKVISFVKGSDDGSTPHQLTVEVTKDDGTTEQRSDTVSVSDTVDLNTLADASHVMLVPSTDGANVAWVQDTAVVSGSAPVPVGQPNLPAPDVTPTVETPTPEAPTPETPAQPEIPAASETPAVVPDAPVPSPDAPVAPSSDTPAPEVPTGTEGSDVPPAPAV